MSMWARSVVAFVLVMVLAGAASAQEAEAFRDREPAPGPALGAAFANVVFMPVRLGVSIVGAELGGFTGFMTAGNRQAAGDVWALFDGQSILTPEILQGKENFRFGSLEFGAR